MSKILKLAPTYFVYNNDIANKRQIGLIAEEIAPLFPELVEFDENGCPDAVNYAQLSALLIYGIQELNAQRVLQQNEIEKQKEQACVQKNEIANLKSMLVMLLDRLDKYDRLDALLNKLDDAKITELYANLG